MRVANPIYDVVFKYLLGDKKIARLLISKIIDEEVLDLDFAPTEIQAKLKDDVKNFTVFRIDFSARIKQADGSSKLVLIEIQKAKLHTDIMRFRKYLGNHYQDENNVTEEPDGTTKALPIISVYFLGHNLEHTKVPVVRVKRKYYDAATGGEIDSREEFIESLTHDSYIIQIPQLKDKRRNDLEVLLSIFDQSKQTPESRHFLNLDENDFPEKYRPIVRRLIRASSEIKICQTMDLEDQVLSEFGILERKIEQKDKTIEQKDKALEQKDKALEKALELLTNQGISLTEAKKTLGLK